MSKPTMEPWRKVESLDDFETLITPNRFSQPLDIEWNQPYFYLNGGRPKHIGFIMSLQFRYLHYAIKSGRLYVARLRNPF